jgi:hypothetical protein
MPVTSWTEETIGGIPMLVISVANFQIPLDWDPTSNMFIAIAAPDGGVGGLPALAQGDPGVAAAMDSTVNLTVLAYTDATPNSATLTTLSPGLYQLNLTIHAGPTGAAGTTTIMGASDVFGSPVPGQVLVVDLDSDGLIYASQMVGDRYIPATINSTPSGNAVFTLCSVGVPALSFDWRPQVSGQSIITGTGADAQVDLIARLNDATSGNIVGRGFGLAGINPPTNVLSAGPPAGSADTYDKVLAGNAATIYLRAERQNGTNTFTTSASTTRFEVRVQPIPGSESALGS